MVDFNSASNMGRVSRGHDTTSNRESERAAAETATERSARIARLLLDPAILFPAFDLTASPSWQSS